MKKALILILFMALVISCATAQDVVSTTDTPTQETVVTTSITTETTEVPQEPTEIPPEVTVTAPASWVWPLVFLVLGILVLLPWLMDTSWNIMIRKNLLSELKDNPELNKPENRDKKLAYYERLLESFAERKGMSRFSLMTAVTLIIGAVMFYLVITDPGSEVLKSSLAVLTGALASIIGFYFGGRSGGTPEDQTKQLEEMQKELDQKTQDLEEMKKKLGGGSGGS